MPVTIKTSYQQHEPLGENFPADLEWVNARRLELYEQYGDCVLLVYHGEIIGVGAGVREATADAEQRLSDKEGIITPLVKYQSSPYRIGVYRRKTSE
jgi:hypothetical protein